MEFLAQCEGEVQTQNLSSEKKNSLTDVEKNVKTSILYSSKLKC